MGSEVSRKWMCFEDECASFRAEMKDLAVRVRNMMNHPVYKSATDGVRDEGEMRANTMLTYRHIEDAIMRVGKMIQAHDGGKSVYPR